MRVDLFSTPVYIINVSSTDGGKALSDAIESTDIESLIEKNTLWNCEVDTGYFNYRTPAGKLKEATENCVLSHARDFMSTTNIKDLDSLEMDIRELWLNRYFKGYSQEPHEHIGDNQVSFNYVHKAAPADKSFHFINTLYPSVDTLWDVTLGFSFSSHAKEIPVELRSGDLILFPSYLVHSVFVKSEGERITLSGNIKLGNRHESR